MSDGKKSGSIGQRLDKKRRSKLGCRNCKLRSVKCDESKPECNRCLQYGVVCSYTSKVATEDLQFSNEYEIVLEVGTPLSLQYQETFFEIPASISYWPTRSDELINTFQVITAQTVSAGPRTKLYVTTVVDKARSYPFMLQALMAVTSMHLRSLSTGMRSNPTIEETGYCYKALSMFSKEVARPRNAEHQAMLLCAAAMLYNLSFANIDAKTPEEAWPLAPPASTDLGWLKISAAKTQIPQLRVPMGNDPLFTMLSSSIGPEVLAQMETLPSVALPLGFISLFGLESTANRSNNPYFVPATRLGRVLDSEDIVFVTLAFILVISEITDDFKALLARKDPRALLLLACWFAKISGLPVWWYRQRAIMEGQAICLYLDRYHSEDMNLQVLLRFPKFIFQQLPGWDIYPSSIEEYATRPMYSRENSIVSSPVSSTSYV